jgi:hypothetical protein
MPMKIGEAEVTLTLKLGLPQMMCTALLQRGSDDQDERDDLRLLLVSMC